MVKSLIVHVGDAKTGSTTLQDVLFNTLYKCQDLSIIYTKKKNMNKLGHHLVQQSLYSDDRIVEEWRATGDYFNRRDSDVGVISGESLSPVDPGRLKSILYRLFDINKKSLKIVCYIRPHCDALISRYSQHIKTGQFTGSISQYYDISKQRLRYEARLQQWKSTFGDSFSVYMFERGALFDEDIVKDFFRRAIGSNSFVLDGVTYKNLSLNLKQLSLCKYYYENLIGPCLKKTRRLRLYPKPYLKIDEVLAPAQMHGGYGEKVRIHRSLWQRMRVDLADDAENVDRILAMNHSMLRALEAHESKVVPSEVSVDVDDHFSAEDAGTLKSLLDFAVRQNKNIQ
ncbi:MAG: hypothetical protein RIC87_11430 [Kiloniellales bacterium]